MFCRVHTSNPNIGNNFTLAAKVNTVRNYSLVISFILRSATLKICRVPQSCISNVHLRCWKLEGIKTLWRFVIKCSLLLAVEKAPRKVREICSFLEVLRRCSWMFAKKSSYLKRRLKQSLYRHLYLINCNGTCGSKKTPLNQSALSGGKWCIRSLIR